MINLEEVKELICNKLLELEINIKYLNAKSYTLEIGSPFSELVNNLHISCVNSLSFNDDAYTKFLVKIMNFVYDKDYKNVVWYLRKTCDTHPELSLVLIAAQPVNNNLSLHDCFVRIENMKAFS